MEYRTLETYSGQSIQASTTNLQSQSTWKGKVGSQTTTSVGQVLVRPTTRGQASQSR